MKKILVSQNISQTCKSYLEKEGFAVLLLPPFGRLPQPVSCHADMLVFKFENKLVIHSDYYKANSTLFDSLGVELELTDEPIGTEYPHDILLNAFLLHDGTLFSKTQYTSDLVKQKAERTVNVNQGYSKCSTCIVSENAVITSDPSLCAAYEKNGLDVLKISPGFVRLDGYDYGFIGGASCNVDGGSVLFFGRVEDHPDYDRIACFSASHGVKLVSMSDEMLTDLGGAVVID